MTPTNNIYRKNAGKIIITILLAALAFIVLYPFIWMLVTSFKPEAEIVSYPPKLFSGRFSLDSYINIWKRVPFLKYYRNTIIFSTAVTVTSLVFDTMAGYAFARLKFPKKNLLFALILAVMIIPAQTVMLPQFSIIYKMGLSNSYLALILPAIASPMYIFLFRQNFMGIPESIEEAAKLDGASAIRTFFQLVVPLAKPVYATVGILVFIACWNDFVWPVMVISDSSKQTIQMALSSLFSIQPVNYGNVMAGLTLVTIPVLIIFLSLQKYYVAGIASTGAKN